MPPRRSRCEVSGFSEIGYERKKAASLSPNRPTTITAQVVAAVRRIEAETSRRGADYLTFRRITEAASLDASAATQLRRYLIATEPEHPDWPLWSLKPVG